MSEKRSVIIPAIMPESEEELRMLSQKVLSFAPEVHLDITDGKFVPKVGWPYGNEFQMGELEECARVGHLPEEGSYSAHLMVEEPLHVGELLVQAGVRRVIAQYEACTSETELRKTLHTWRVLGAQHVGVAFLLDTPTDTIIGIADEVDEIQVMSIATIGVQGNPFDNRALLRIQELRTLFPNKTISCDGGITRENALAVVESGADRLIVGSAIIKATDPKEAYHLLQEQ